MKKSRKQRNRKRSSKRLPHAKQPDTLQKKKVEPSHSPWLQILPGDIDDVPFHNAGRASISQRNGRRELRDNTLYLAERNLPSGRIVR
jgi:hypothetical protein